jgi:DNA-binding NarL/FixJ family response regulator
VHKPAVSFGLSRLLERSSQIAMLNEHLAAVRVDGGRVVFVGGEARVGKTTLVRAFCAEQPRSVRIVSGSCDALFTPRLGTRSNAAQLTPRQLEILELPTQGLRNAEIAERLYLSARTVDHHVSAILDKLELARAPKPARRQSASASRHHL